MTDDPFPELGTEPLEISAARASLGPRPRDGAEINADLHAMNARDLANEDYADAWDPEYEGGSVGAPAIVAALLAISERLEALHGDLVRIEQRLMERDR